jgi:hypothetical protein
MYNVAMYKCNLQIKHIFIHGLYVNILTSSSSSSSHECDVLVPVGNDIGTDVEYTVDFFNAATLRSIGVSASL